jgi:beta-lactamase class A
VDLALEQRIRALLERVDARTSVYAKHLPSGREVAIHADEPVNALSTIKVALLVLAFRDAEAGLLKLDQRVALRVEAKRRGTGVLQTFDPGLQLSFRDLVTQMIVSSDNTATDILIGRLGLERVNTMLADLGYTKTRLQRTIGAGFRRLWERADPATFSWSDQGAYERGYPSDPDAPARAFAMAADPAEWLAQTTAREMSRLLEQIQNAELASREASDQMLGILGQQIYASRLPRRIAQRASVAHKTGDWPPAAGHDVGILYGADGPIVVSVFASENRGDFVELEAVHGWIAEWLLDAWGGG